MLPPHADHDAIVRANKRRKPRAYGRIDELLLTFVRERRKLEARMRRLLKREET